MPLPAPWAAVLSAVVGAPRAWSTPGEIAGMLGWEREQVDAPISELHANGLLGPWGAAWTLTPFSAGELGVELVDDDGLVGRERWAPVGRPRRRAARGEAPPDPALSAADPGPGPAELAADRLDAPRPRRPGPAGPDALPRPTVLLTGCASTWSEATQHEPPPSRGRPRPKRRRPAGPCSACKGAPLPRSAYCLRCDRWGFDGVLKSRRPRGGRAAG